MKNWFAPNTLFLVLGLGINCTIGYGTLFYSFSLLSIELEESFGWSKEFLFGMYSLGILLSGLASPFFGKYLDKYRARWPMTLGSFITVITLFFLSQINSPFEFAIGIILLEGISILVLYESAFVAVTQVTGKKSRLPITQITLIAGFASTIFWPLISWVLSWGDWRQVYFLMGLLHLLICLPVHWWVLKPKAGETIEADTSKGDKMSDKTIPEKHSSVKANQSQHYLIETVLAFCLGFSAFTINSLQIHIFRIMEALSISEQLALLAGVLVGPLQVVARVLDMWLGRYITPFQLGMVSFMSMSLGLCLLIAATVIDQRLSLYTVVLFACLFGAGQGLSYIVRGIIPLALFGAKQYGAITGRMNGVRMIMTAIAPFSFAVMMEAMGVNWSLTVLLVILILCTLGIYGLQQYMKA